MLKKIGLRKLAITTSALLAIGLLYLFPVKDELVIEKNITYIEETLYEVYLIDKSDYVASLNLPLISSSVEDILKEKLEMLTINSSKTKDIPSGFKPIIPNGTVIKSLKIDEDTVTVNFSKEILSINSEYEEKMIEAIVFTLTSEEGIEKVLIKVEGETLERLPNSNKLLPIPLDRSYGINKYYDINSLYNMTMTTIYYVNNINDTVYYVPVSKITNNKEEKISVIVDELKSSVVYQSNLRSYLSASAELKEYEIIENTMHLTFNDKIFSIDDNILEEVKYSISLSVKENYDVDEVVFYVDGEIVEE